MRRSLASLGGALCLSAAGAAWGQDLGQPAPASLYGVAPAEIATLPSAAEITAAAPKRRAEGSAAAHCTVGPSGILAGCSIMLQRGRGFGAALLALAPVFRLKPAQDRPAGTDVVISTSWPVADAAADWRVPPTDDDFATSAPPAAFHYGKPGFAVLNCLIGRLGTTYDCMVTYQRPMGMGFGTMVLRLAPYLKLTPALVAGKPVPSGVNIPFHVKAATTDRIR